MAIAKLKQRVAAAGNFFFSRNRPLLLVGLLMTVPRGCMGMDGKEAGEEQHEQQFAGDGERASRNHCDCRGCMRAVARLCRGFMEYVSAFPKDMYEKGDVGWQADAPQKVDAEDECDY